MIKSIVLLLACAMFFVGCNDPVLNENNSTRLTNGKFVPITFEQSSLKTAENHSDESPYVFNPAKYVYNEYNAKTFCENGNTKRGELNQSGYNYCMLRQIESSKQIHSLIYSNLNYWFGLCVDDAWNHYTKRGVTDYTMVRYTVDRQLDSYKTYSYEISQPSFDEGKMNRCKMHGDRFSPSNRWSQVMFCYENDLL